MVNLLQQRFAPPKDPSGPLRDLLNGPWFLPVVAVVGVLVVLVVIHFLLRKKKSP